MIEPLEINLKPATEEQYAKARANFIAERSSLFTREECLTRWDQSYPLGFESYKKQHGDYLTSAGQQRLIDKVNELVEYVNAISDVLPKKNE